MGFLSKVKYFATGKTEIERKQEAIANRVIKEKAMAARFRERQKQSLRIATESERISADRKIKQMKTPRQPFFAPISMGVGGQKTEIFGGVQRPTIKKPKIIRRTRTVPIKRNGKIIGYKQIVKNKTEKKAKRVPQVTKQKRFDILGGGDFRII